MRKKESPIKRARAEGRTTLTEVEAKSLLADSGIDIPAFEVTSTPDAAADAAQRIGFPVVLKISSPEVTHKSEWMDGLGVNVSLADRNHTAAVAAEILDSATQTDIDAEILVESDADVTSGTEFIVGGVRDPSFGPVVLTGLGGVFTEIFEDTTHRLAPIDDETAKAAVQELQSLPILEGYRGSPRVDMDALTDTIRRVSNLLVEYEDIAEIDVNPVLATEDGAMALDALVVLED